MSSSELTSLATRIRGEIELLDAVVLRALEAWPHAQERSAAAAAHLDSTALQLHGCYSGIERLFELIARHVDRSAPSGDSWHRDLLVQMAREVPGVRPAVIGAQLVAGLDDQRRFSHVVRHLYTVHLDPARMRPLLDALPGLWHEVRADLLAFADFLDDLARRKTPDT